MTAPLEIRGGRWIAVPGASDVRGSINFLQLGKGLDFMPQRLFWFRGVAAGEWRGRQAYRDTDIVMFALQGACRLHLDDGASRQSVLLEDPAKAVHLAPWVWHELTDFRPDSAIVVVASALLDEAGTLRDYDVFKRERPR
jgi:hypothetical protein